ncbi:MAG: TetR family transcriptional regulator [Nitriliruptorales bacterium]|nr:TetR family transcriptional regulator [Nitriliruptorales bacterium]
MGQTEQKVTGERRTRLNRDRVLHAAVELADTAEIDAVSMRILAERLGVVPMALYKHVANKDELLDGMVDVIVGEIDSPSDDGDWKRAVRARVLSARRALLRHPWARQAIESRPAPTPTVLEYMNSMIGMFRTGGFSVDLTHHVMHAFGSRMWGFMREVVEETERRCPVFNLLKDAGVNVEMLWVRAPVPDDA